MPLPALNDFEVAIYLDTFTVYMATRDGRNNPAGYVIRPISATDPTPLQDVPCNYHATPNYDVEQTGAPVNSKSNNMFTSDKVTCQWQVTIEASDVVAVTTRQGLTYWRDTQGEPLRSVLIPHARFFLVPTNAPTDASGVPIGIP